MDYSDINKFGEWNSEEEADDQINKTHSWQTVNNKRRQIQRQTSKDSTEQITITNRFQTFHTEDNDNNYSENNLTNKYNDNDISHKPPPINIYGVTNYKEMVPNLASATEMGTYITKAMGNNIIKINPKTPDTYRKLVHHLRNEQIIHHTYQLKEERAFRAVIHGLHHSIPTSEIKNELE
jgi:predicted membrane-bound mannosyltransferase